MPTALEELRATLASESDPSEVRELAARDLEARWRRGEKVPVEAYFGSHFVFDDPSARAELIYAELFVRESLGERPELAEYEFRFPDLASQLAEMIRIHRALIGEPPVRATQPAPLEPAVDWDDYEVMEELGRGGMSVVYRARHRELGRIVALKLLRAEACTSDSETRLRREAESLARVPHANIVQVYEVGRHDGRPYLAIEYVNGGTLADRLRDGALSPRQSAELVRTVAQAVHAAHLRGIVHRDLKPGNILLQLANFIPQGETRDRPNPPVDLQFAIPKVMDFGLARCLDLSRLSHSGDVIGTPSYMSPEQARGSSEVTPATDIYSLGVILYECVTGLPPFRGDSPLVVLSQVAEAYPAPPSKLRHGLSADLESVCLKCMEKDPRRRYASANNLADDLGRYLEGLPTHARPLSMIGRAVRMVRRYPMMAGLSAVILASVTLGICGILWQWREAVSARAGLQTALSSEAEQRRHAEESLYIVRLAQAATLWDGGDAREARSLLSAGIPADGQSDFRGWEWRHLQRRFRTEDQVIPFDGWINGLALMPDRPETLAIAAGKPRLNAAYKPTAEDGTTGFLDLNVTPSTLGPGPHLSGAATAVAVQPNGPLIAWASNTGQIVFVNRDSRDVVRSVNLGEPLSVNGLAFTPDGRSLVIGSDGEQLRIIDVASGQVILDKALAVGTGMVLAVDRTGQTLAIGGGAGRIQLLKLPDGDAIGELPNHPRGVSALTFSPIESVLVAGCGDGSVVFWDFAERREIRRLASQTGPVYAFAFDISGRTLAVGGADRNITLWNAANGNYNRTLRGNESTIRSLAFVGNDRIASGAQDGTVRIWNLSTSAQGRRTVFHDHLNDIAFCAKPDGLCVRAVDLAGGLGRWSITDGVRSAGATVDLRNRPSYPVRYTAFLGGGQHVAGILQSDPKSVAVWDADSGERLKTWTSSYGEVLTLASDPACRSLAWVTEIPNGIELHWHDDAGDKIVVPIRLEIGPVRALALDPINRRVALLTYPAKDNEQAVWICDVDSGHSKEISRCRDALGGMAFSRDGKLLGVASSDKLAIFRTDAWTRLQNMPCSQAVTSLAFSPDGRRLAAIGYDGVAMLFDPWTGTKVYTLRGLLTRRPNDTAVDARVAFSSDGHWLVSTNWDGSLSFWNGSPKD